jgi:cellulose synthase (UDP-forming)
MKSNTVDDERRSRNGLKTVSIAGLIFVIVVFCSMVLADMTMPAQYVLSATLFVSAIVISWIKKSEPVRLVLLLISVVASGRYITWRLLHTLNFGSAPETTISIMLFAAECYTVYTMVAFYFQTLCLDYVQNDVEFDPDFTPSVDIFISTLNEPVDILRRTASGALSVDYHNKRVYILDDGNRMEMRELATELGCEYITRPDNRYAKSGNVNNALPQTSGELILFLDADQIPFRTILKCITPLFKSKKVALVQTAHRCLNPGPIERNLYLDGVLPNEQELFFQLVQVGNNFWNATFFCGSSAVIRRTALLEVGGMAIETVTEDTHTSIRLHIKGYESKYFSRPLSIGLSPESLNGWVIQHCRWARGVTQLMRAQNPFLQKGLTWEQRYCYFNGMVHFWLGIPRLIFFLAPVAFLLFGLHPVRVSFIDYIAMAVPFIFLGALANSYIFKNFRHSFWADVYEAVLAAPYAMTVLYALIDPRTGKFNVTPKGTTITKSYLDWVSTPNLIILVFLLAAAASGVYQWFANPAADRWSLGINLMWNFYNIFAIIPAIFCALEHAATKRAHPVERQIPAEFKVSGSNGIQYSQTESITEFGCILRMERKAQIAQMKIRQPLQLTLHTDTPRFPDLKLNGTISYLQLSNNDVLIGVEFQDVSSLMSRSLIETIYCDETVWKALKEPEDNFAMAFGNLISTPWRVFIRTRHWLFQDKVVALASKLDLKSVSEHTTPRVAGSET